MVIGHKKKSGQAIMEMVLVLPLLLLLIAGTMDFGKLFFTKIVMTNAVREGVNYISRHPDDKTNCDPHNSTLCYLETVDIIQKEADSSNVTVSRSEITFTDCCTEGSAVQVRITKPVNLMFGQIFALFGAISDPVQLVSTARMVVQ